MRLGDEVRLTAPQRRLLGALAGMGPAGVPELATRLYGLTGSGRVRGGRRAAVTRLWRRLWGMDLVTPPWGACELTDLGRDAVRALHLAEEVAA